MLCGDRQINYHLTAPQEVGFFFFSLKKISAHHLYFYLPQETFLIFLGTQALCSHDLNLVCLTLSNCIAPFAQGPVVDFGLCVFQEASRIVLPHF